MHLKHRLSSALWPRYSLTVDQINHNAKYREWLSAHDDIHIFHDRENLYSFVDNEYCRGEPIDFIEFGVHEGASIRKWAEINRHPDSRFVGFDSFEGLPEAWGKLVPAGEFDVGGKMPEIDDPRVRFVKGWFQDTLGSFLAEFQPRSRLVVHHDSDLYSSVLYCLTKMDTLLEPGSILLYDEFASALHEFRAHQDYVQAFRRRARPIAMTDVFTARVAFVVEASGS